MYWLAAGFAAGLAAVVLVAALTAVLVVAFAAGLAATVLVAALATGLAVVLLPDLFKPLIS